MVVTIDGPAGSGKSSTARAVADRLGWIHLNSGQLYRALALGLMHRGLSANNLSEIAVADLRSVRIHLWGGRSGLELRLDDGPLLPRLLLSGEVSHFASRIAALAEVRKRLLPVQRQAAELGSMVADGRDMGSVVFPNAQLKLYLVADLRERALRRLKEQGGPTDPATLEDDPEALEQKISEISTELERRDRYDSRRRHAPLIRPPDSHLIDTTGLTCPEQVEMVLRLVRSIQRS